MKRYQNLTFEGHLSEQEVLQAIFYNVPSEIYQRVIRELRWNYRVYTDILVREGHYRATSRVENWNNTSGDKAHTEIAFIHTKNRTEVFYSCSCEKFQKSGKVCKHLLVAIRKILSERLFLEVLP